MLNAFSGRLWSREDPMLETLRKIPFFSDLKQGELREVQELLKPQAHGPGEAVFKQGEPGVGMYVVMSGGVEFLHEDEDGAILRLGEVGPEAVFGEMALLDDAPRTASAVTMEETELAVLFRTDLLSMAEARSRLGVKIVMHLSQIVAERLRRTNRALKEVRAELGAARDTLANGDGEPKP